ncbi:MAG: translation initiation factor IF-2, partial [Hymenobacteraceae bacterium]|nr:translation initiation factor IF-2 [Hymenobacteraceae bacterium]MDX5397055.1 translation initiation factor IF-2 [Hymenobacteraceae bacterium]MDX5513126.1 translation initiation factor IF-2 [Hymenobacteraceae bacterium]
MNIGTSTIVDYLSAKGFDIQNKPTAKITAEQFNMLRKEFASSIQDKQEAAELNIGKKPQSNVVIDTEHQEPQKPAREQEEEILIKNVQTSKPAPAPQPKEEPQTGSRLQGIKV